VGYCRQPRLHSCMFSSEACASLWDGGSLQGTQPTHCATRPEGSRKRLGRKSQRVWREAPRVIAPVASCLHMPKSWLHMPKSCLATSGNGPSSDLPRCRLDLRSCGRSRLDMLQSEILRVRLEANIQAHSVAERIRSWRQDRCYVAALQCSGSLAPFIFQRRLSSRRTLHSAQQSNLGSGGNAAASR
jgi:hypothetical protein